MGSNVNGNRPKINLFQTLKGKIFIFLAVFGPATITAISDNDAAGVATYSLVGSKFGYSILITLLIVIILLAATQEMGVRIAMVTGKGLGDLIRERYGIKISILVFFCLFIANMGTIVADLSAIKATTNMFKLPTTPFLIIFILIIVGLITKASYKTNQKFFLIATLLYFSYVISAFRTNPDWFIAIKSLVMPTNINLSKEFILGAITVLGTTITPWGQFFVHSYLIDKKLGIKRLKYLQIETYFGSFLTGFFSFFMIVATAATLFVHGIVLVSGEQASLAIKPFAGNLASILFGIGLVNAGLMGVIIVGLCSAYAFAEFFGVEGSLDAPFEKGRLFYGIFIIQVILAALLVSLPFVNLFSIVYITQTVNAILLPFIFYFLLKITNNRDLMGEYINRPVHNYFVVILSVVIVLASLFAIITNFLPI